MFSEGNHVVLTRFKDAKMSSHDSFGHVLVIIWGRKIFTQSRKFLLLRLWISSFNEGISNAILAPLRSTSYLYKVVFLLKTGYFAVTVTLSLFTVLCTNIWNVYTWKVTLQFSCRLNALTITNIYLMKAHLKACVTLVMNTTTIA